MVQSLTQIQCPNCQSPIQASIEQLIDVGQDPSAKARLLSGNLNRTQCPVCGFEGQLASPLVYHDPEHELLLTYIPVELGIAKNEQERILGQLINQVMSHLQPEQRKGYLLQPQAVLTLQGLVERILEADGVTREEIEAQRAKMRLFEDLLRTPEEELEAFVTSNDEALDSSFFQLASLTIQVTNEPQAQHAASIRLERALELSSFGKRLKMQEAELEAATESLKAAGEGLTREKILDLLIEAPNQERVVALVNLTRPALDYTFFQDLTERIDGEEGASKERLQELRQRILEITEQIDKVQEARTAQTAALIKSLVEAEDLDASIQSALPMVDDLFLGILEANIRVAKERGQDETLARLEMIRDRIQTMIQESLPPNLQLAQKLLSTKDENQAQTLLEGSPDLIDDQFLNTLMATADRFEKSGEDENADWMKTLYRLALRISMKAKLKGE